MMFIGKENDTIYQLRKNWWNK